MLEPRTYSQLQCFELCSVCTTKLYTVAQSAPCLQSSCLPLWGPAEDSLVTKANSQSAGCLKGTVQLCPQHELIMLKLLDQAMTDQWDPLQSQVLLHLVATSNNKR